MKIISKIDPLKRAAAVAKDTQARKDGKSARAVEKLEADAVSQMMRIKSKITSIVRSA